MICRICGGQVLWVGPLTNASHTQCQRCKEYDCQMPEDHGEDDIDNKVEK